MVAIAQNVSRFLFISKARMVARDSALVRCVLGRVLTRADTLIV